jgi:hypothetical protein
MEESTLSDRDNGWPIASPEFFTKKAKIQQENSCYFWLVVNVGCLLSVLRWH